MRKRKARELIAWFSMRLATVQKKTSDFGNLVSLIGSIINCCSENKPALRSSRNF